MGLKSGFGKLLLYPLIIWNTLLAIIILALAGRLLDKSLTSSSGFPSSFQGNGATPYLVLFSLIAAALAIASYIYALHHTRVWRADSGSAAQAISWIAWLLLIIAFCLAWKEVHIGGHRVKKVKALEAFVIALTFFHFLYLLALHLEDHGNSSDGRGQYKSHKPLNPNAPGHQDKTAPAAAASAV